MQDAVQHDLRHVRPALARAWQDAPPWARSPVAWASLTLAMVVACLMALGMVVQGVVDRSAQRQEAINASVPADLQATAHATPADPGLVNMVSDVQR